MKRSIKKEWHKMARKRQAAINNAKRKAVKFSALTMEAKRWVLLVTCTGLYTYGAYVIASFLLGLFE